MLHRSCPKCGSGWVTQHYCGGGCHCKHRSAKGCGREHLRLTCTSCGYGWNEATLDHRGSAVPEVRPVFEGDEGAPKLPTVRRRQNWRTQSSGRHSSSGNRHSCSV